VSAPHRLLLPPPRHATAAIPMLFDCCLLVPMLIVLTLLGLNQCHRPIDADNSANTSTGMVQFQYWASIGAHTGIDTAAMAFISSMGTCQVPVPVLAPPGWRSFPVWALAKCPYQYWHCRDGVHFQYGHLPSAHTSIGIAAMEFFSSMGTSRGPIPVLARSITNNGKYSLPILMILSYFGKMRIRK